MICYLYFPAIISSQTQQNSVSTVQSVNSNVQFKDELVENVVTPGDIRPLTSSDCLGISGISEMSQTLPTFEPKFNYVTFNSANTAQIMAMIVVNPQVNI